MCHRHVLLAEASQVPIEPAPAGHRLKWRSVRGVSLYRGASSSRVLRKLTASGGHGDSGRTVSGACPLDVHNAASRPDSSVSVACLAAHARPTLPAPLASDVAAQAPQRSGEFGRLGQELGNVGLISTGSSKTSAKVGSMSTRKNPIWHDTPSILRSCACLVQDRYHPKWPWELVELSRWDTSQVSETLGDEYRLQLAINPGTGAPLRPDVLRPEAWRLLQMRRGPPSAN